MASSTPATSAKVTFGRFSESIFARERPNESAWLPPLCACRKIKNSSSTIIASGAERHEAREQSGIRLLVEADRAALDLTVDLVDESLIEIGNGNRVLRAVGEIADGVEPGSVERLNLSRLELLVEGTIIESRLAFARRNEALDHDEDVR